MAAAPHLARLTGTVFALALLVAASRQLASSATFDASSIAETPSSRTGV